MFQNDIQTIVAKGVISLRSKMIGDKVKFYGDTVADSAALIAVYGASAFWESEYNDVLKAASEQWDVGLATLIVGLAYN